MQDDSALPRPTGRCLRNVILHVLQSHSTLAIGGSCRIRTCDQLIKSQLLYQLS